MVILQESIKQELNLSDTQLGLMSGFTFAIFYVSFGIPIARLADKGNRRNIIAISLAVWSAMTAISGSAQNFTQLLLARIGVGIGEAGGSPPAHSIISDLYPPKKRATAMAIYSTGISIGILLGFSLLGYFLYLIQSVLVYVIIAAVISLIARPIIRFLQKKLKFPNTLSVVTTMILFVGFLVGIIRMFIPLVIEQGENLSLLHTDKLLQNLQDVINQVNDYFTSKNINLLSKLKNIDFLSGFQEIPNLLNSVASALGSLSVGLFSVLFISFFFMKDSKLLMSSVLTILPNKSEHKFSKSTEIIKNLLSRYFIGLVAQITILFVLYTITLLIFGIKNAVVIAFLCALLNLIPYIGPMIGAIIMFLLSMSSNLGQDFQTEILPTTIYVMIGYFITQLVDNFFSQPFIFSKTTKSHPLEIFLIIIIGGLLFGVVGMITAVPLYTALKVILKVFLSDNRIVKSLTKDI